MLAKLCRALPNLFDQIWRSSNSAGPRYGRFRARLGRNWPKFGPHRPGFSRGWPQAANLSRIWDGFGRNWAAIPHVAQVGDQSGRCLPELDPVSPGSGPLLGKSACIRGVCTRVAPECERRCATVPLREALRAAAVAGATSDGRRSGAQRGRSRPFGPARCTPRRARLSLPAGCLLPRGRRMAQLAADCTGRGRCRSCSARLGEDALWEWCGADWPDQAMGRSSRSAFVEWCSARCAADLVLVPRSGRAPR